MARDSHFRTHHRGRSRPISYQNTIKMPYIGFLEIVTSYTFRSFSLSKIIS